MVASGMGVSVISAAILEGNLILGLSDGSVINAGVAQGPMGLTGPQGPVGATGRPGRDGNTIHSVEGAPGYDLGTEGDFAINTVDWEVYGPKASGQWGTGTPMIGGGGRNKREVNKGGDTRTDSGGGDGRPPIVSPDGDLTPPTQYPGAKPIRDGDFWIDGNGALHVYYRSGWNKIRVYADMVLPAGDAPAGSSRDAEGSVVVPGNGGTGQAIAEAANGEKFANQYEFNNWLYYRVDRPPIVADDEPAEHPDFSVTGLKAGDFWINSGNQLFVWKENQWRPLFAKGLLDVSDTAPDAPQTGQLWFSTKSDELTLYVYDGAVWVPASPPVSLDGIESSITVLQDYTTDLNRQLANQTVEAQKADLKILNLEESQEQQDQKIAELEDDQQRQDEKIAELEGEVDDLKPSIERGEWTYNASPEDSNNPVAGEYHAYVVVSDSYCQQKLAECYAEANKGDTPEADAAACNRENGDCVDKIGEIDPDVPWHEVQWLVMARTDDSGRIHDFGDVVPGMYVEAINLDGSGHGLYVIKNKSVNLGRAGLEVEPVHSTGHPNGKAVVKIFKMAEAPNPDDFVRKSGDEMTGQLTITTEEGVTTGNVLRLNAGSTLLETENIFDIRNNSGTQMFWIDSLDIGTKRGWLPTHSTHVANKQYVDSVVSKNQGGGKYGVPYKYVDPNKGAQNLENGEFFVSNKSEPTHSVYISSYDIDGTYLVAPRKTGQSVKGTFKVYTAEGQLVHSVLFYYIDVGSSNNKYIKYTKDYNFTEPSDLVVGQIYYIADGLLLPF